MRRVPGNSPWHPQAPHITDPEQGEAPQWEAGTEENDESEGSVSPSEGETPKPNWLRRAKDAYRFSTTYVDSNYRKQWEDSIRAFHSMHPSDSKYNSDVYRKRSNLYRPRTRTVIRKNEAAAAAAFFSNLELVSISAVDESVKEEVASAEVMQQLLQYRLTKSIPWFPVVIGGIQDTQVQGAACAHVYWKFSERVNDKGVVTAKEDTPCIDLFPIENMRIDPSAHWLDPVNTSPYLIHLIPMYWCDVKDRMTRPDPKGRRWKEYDSSQAFAKASTDTSDTTRMARNPGQQDPADEQRTVSDYDIVWVHRHIHRHGGIDYEFYTLASELLLTDPEPLTDTVWHGHRPYVMGVSSLETHRPIPSSMPTVIRGLQDEANEVANQRMDNIKFVLNKAYYVKRGKNVDLSSLVRNVPGRIMMVDDPEKDVRESEWNDVTQSAYAEQDRIDADLNDLAGNFSPLQVQTARTPRESTRTMQMLQSPANLLTEYMLKTYVETFVQPVLRQVMLLEQYYESDSVILGIAAQKSQVAQKFGANDVTDALLNRELTLTVNVGMGATDPVAKLQRFVYGVTSFAQIARLMPPGIDLKTVAKEIFGLSGYQDGTRFMIQGQDPMVVKLMQQNKQLMMMLQKAGIQIKNKEDANKVKLITSRESNATKLAMKAMDHNKEGRHKLADHIMQMDRAEHQASLAALNPPEQQNAA